MWTPLLHVTVSWLHRQLSTLDIVFHVNACYTEHCYSMYMSHRYTGTVKNNTVISCPCSTDTRMHYFTGYRDFIYLYHYYTEVYKQLYHVHTSSYIDHRQTCVDYFCILIAWITVHITWIIDTWIFLY